MKSIRDRLLIKTRSRLLKETIKQMTSLAKCSVIRDTRPMVYSAVRIETAKTSGVVTTPQLRCCYKMSQLKERMDGHVTLSLDHFFNFAKTAIE